MSILGFLGVVFCAYLCGMVGSLLSAYCLASKEKSPGGGAAIFIFVLLYQVITFWPVQLLKITVAVVATYLLIGSGHVLVGSCLACAIAGFVSMLLFPRVMRRINRR